MRANKQNSPRPGLAARAVAIAVACCLALTACYVEPEAVELSVDPNVRAALEARAVNDALLEPVDELPTNEAGEQLLERVISGTFAADDCVVDISGLPVIPECGWLTRPLHGAYVDDIELPVMIFRATGPNPSTTPMVYLHGGPSDGILQYFDPELVVDPVMTYDFIIEPWIETRDVIVFDQRGTGLAEPDLGCDGPEMWFNARDEDPETFVPRTASTCATTLRLKGIRMDQFSRQTSADDVMVLARELGLEQIDLHGSSWGGILA